MNGSAPNFQAASPLEGSSFPDRTAYNPQFKATEILTESLAKLATAVKQQLGFSQEDLILQCQYDGTPCDLQRLSPAFLCHSQITLVM